MKYFLDTNTIIYAVKGKYPAIADHFARTHAQSIMVPSIVVAEIEYGAEKSSDYSRTIAVYNRFLNAFRNNIAEFSYSAAVEYGIIRAELEKAGTPIGPNDLIIAAIVKANDGILVTHNVGEFSRVRGLRIEDWTE